MTTQPPKKKTNVIWRLFRSVKLTVVLLILLAIASIIGTVIPQMPQRESIEFARSLSPETFRLFESLNLFDMYQSIWFRFLIGCLGLNLIICSLDRFPGTWKLYKSKPRPDRSKPFENLPPELTFTISKKTVDIASGVEQFLTKQYNKAHSKNVEDTHYFYTEKGNYSRFGVYIVHASILLILIGALVGSFLGFEADVNIPEGEQITISDIHLKKGTLSKGLNFSIRCDKFFVDFYKSGAPKEYRSELTFLINEKEVKKSSLLVNHPPKFMGNTYYQSN